MLFHSEFDKDWVWWYRNSFCRKHNNRENAALSTPWHPDWWKTLKSTLTHCCQSRDWNWVFSIIIKLAFQYLQEKKNCWKSFAFCVRLQRCHLQAGGLFHSQAFRCSFSPHPHLHPLPEKVTGHTTAYCVKNWPARPFCKKGPTFVLISLESHFAEDPPPLRRAFLECWQPL